MFARFFIYPLIAMSFTFVNPCDKAPAGPKKPGANDTVYDVKVIYPKFTSVPQRHTVDGVFDVSETVNVMATAPGEVEQLYVDVGDVVTKDDPIISLTNTQLTDLIDLKRAKVKELQARLKQAQAKLNITGGEDLPVTIEDTLFLDEEPVIEEPTAKPYGDANRVQKPATLKALAEVLETTIDSINKQTDVLDRKLLNLTHNSPIGGVVTKKFVAESNPVKEKDHLVEISKTDPMSVSFELPEKMASFIDKHSSVKVSPIDATEVTGSGTVYYIDPNLDSGNETIKVRAHVSNEDGRIKGGQKAKVRVATRKMARVIVLPKTVLYYEDDKPFVFTIHKEQAKLVSVTTGEENEDGTIQIFGDLRIDDPIIIDRPVELKHNSYVKVLKKDDSTISDSPQ